MKRQCFDYEWRFRLSDPRALWWRRPDSSTWHVVDLPHDWSIELPRAPENPSGASGGYFEMGYGLYQKTFTAPDAWKGKKVFIEFEGVYMNAEVKLNGNLLGRHPYGYTSFHYDLTPYLTYGETENVLSVTVDNACQRNSRWYSGSGIYRHVWLMVADPVHIGHWGVYVTTPEVSPEKATVQVQTRVENETNKDQDVTFYAHISAPDGSSIGSMEKCQVVQATGEHTFTQEIHLHQPQLWSPDTPNLYTLDVEILIDDCVVDAATTPFGIRSLAYDAERGFLLNGQPLKLKGGCVHHDDGILGAASYDRSEERKVEVLKASGYNAIRCAHNPPAPAFLDACDRLGMLVIDEAFDCWRAGKNPYDYHVSFPDWWQRDLDSMLFRDRNHPSIIMWSIGNEVAERAGASNGVEIAQQLAGRIREVDPTRPVTAAINGSHDAWPWEQTDGVFGTLDIGGYNYQERQYRSDHERRPQRVMYGSESTAEEAFQHWMSVLELDYVIGDFVWTSLDYLGEAGIGRVYFEGEKFGFLGEYPWNQANCGDLDLCGFKRPQSYYRDILWERGHKLYIAVHDPVPEDKTPKTTYWGWPLVWPNWTWPGREGETFKVDVYSACEKVELFLNDTSLGTQPTTREERFIASFDVPYAPGVLKAVGYQNGEPCAEYEIQTVGKPAGITLTPDRPTLKIKRGDLSFVTVDIVDAERRRHPSAENTVFFTAQGVGDIIAVGNGNPASTEPYRGNWRNAFHGRCLVVVKANGLPGEIHLRAQADGLDSVDVMIQVG